MGKIALLTKIIKFLETPGFVYFSMSLKVESWISEWWWARGIDISLLSRLGTCPRFLPTGHRL